MKIVLIGSTNPLGRLRGNKEEKMRWRKKKPAVGATIPKSQQSIFDIAERKKNEGMEASYLNADTDWKRAARDRVHQLAETRQYFTADDVIECLDEKGIVTGNNSALGAIFKAFARSGIIKPTDTYKKSRRPSRHRAPIQVWESNVIKEGRV